MIITLKTKSTDDTTSEQNILCSLSTICNYQQFHYKLVEIVFCLFMQFYAISSMQLTLTLPGPSAGVGGSLTVTVA